MRPIRLRFFLFALAFAAAPVFADALLWFEGGHPTAQAVQAVDVLAAAATQGLDPRDYDVKALRERLSQARGLPGLTDTAQAALDGALTSALQRYLADLQDGRVDPRQLHADFDVQRRARPDATAWLREAVAARRVAQALADAEPRLPMYAALREALARYRMLENDAAWQVPLAPLPRGKVVPGAPYAGLAVLARRLEAVGDLAAGAALPERYEGALVDAVQSFQERHGLTPDGVLGQATLRALEVAPAARARQIELAMERLRWTPFMQGPRMVVVNVPEFVLRAYDVRDGRVDVKLAMKVIVGKAMDTRTPLFDEAMRFIEFSPYWNVPPSIARQEVVPRLRRDPGYFQREGFEFVTGGGSVVASLSPDALDAVLHGGWRIRQRPGPKNALGDIKFVFPNKDNIYLHHTPAPQLFARDRRDFSHGCIRIQDPVALARFVLDSEPGWTEDRIREEMGKGESHTLKLREAVPVLIAYSTVVAKRGRVYFYTDLYGHDRLLDTALRRRSGGMPP